MVLVPSEGSVSATVRSATIITWFEVCISNASLRINMGAGLALILPLPHWPICCDECKIRQISKLFWTRFFPNHALWNGCKEMKYSGVVENNCRDNIHTYCQATNTFIGLFFEFWGKNWFFVCQNAAWTNWAYFRTNDRRREKAWRRKYRQPRRGETDRWLHRQHRACSKLSRLEKCWLLWTRLTNEYYCIH